MDVSTKPSCDCTCSPSDIAETLADAAAGVLEDLYEACGIMQHCIDAIKSGNERKLSAALEQAEKFMAEDSPSAELVAALVER